MKMPVLEEIKAPLQHCDTRIGSMLRGKGIITAIDTERILKMQKDRGVRFGEATRMLNLATEDEIRQLLAQQFGYPCTLVRSSLSVSLLVARQPNSDEAEAYRTTRSQLNLRYFKGGCNALAVLPANDSVNASAFAGNLAIAFAQLGRSTVLVDANLRSPNQHLLFGLPIGKGLADLTAGRAGMEVIQRIDGFEALSVLAAGTIPPNPQELLNCDSFLQIGDDLAAQYDVVLYDVPSPQVGADGFNIAAQCGGAILIAGKDKTRSVEVRAIRAQLEATGVELLGAVMVNT